MLEALKEGEESLDWKELEYEERKSVFDARYTDHSQRWLPLF